MLRKNAAGCDSFFFQAEDGIRDGRVTGVQTCALPILAGCPTFGEPSVEGGLVQPGEVQVLLVEPGEQVQRRSDPGSGPGCRAFRGRTLARPAAGPAQDDPVCVGADQLDVLVYLVPE